MEARKLQFASDLVEKIPPDQRTDIPNFIERFQGLTRRARACYEEHISLSIDGFARLMVLDSCFIIWLSLSIFEEANGSSILNANLKEVQSDLLFMENQIPLFFVHRVYAFFREHLFLLPTFPTILEIFICLDLPWRFNREHSWKANHLLDLYCRCFSLLETTSMFQRVSWGNCSVVPSDHVFLERIRRYIEAVKVTPNASQLYKRAGVEFQKRSYDDGFRVTFQNGIMSMPSMKIDTICETLFENLVAFENVIDPKNRVVTSYMVMMDALVDTEKDVRILSTNKMVANFFNNIGNICLIDYNDHFFNLFRYVQKFYHSSYNHSLASLHRNYFSTPWKGISVAAGTLLLVLSALQTFFIIFSYYHLRH